MTYKQTLLVVDKVIYNMTKDIIFSLQQEIDELSNNRSISLLDRLKIKHKLKERKKLTLELSNMRIEDKD
jgi:hypothetical protein